MSSVSSEGSAGRSKSTAPLPCLSEDELLAHLAGTPGAETADRVLRHVDVCPRCRRMLAVAAQALGPRSGVAAPGVSRTLDEGDLVVGRYEVRRFVARGGMGEVYEAYDRLLDEPVALKTLACTSLDDARAAFRFKAEARLARRVSHPNVCRILEFGIHTRPAVAGASERVPFLTMELLQGETLRERIKRLGPMTPATAWPLLDQVLAGLEAIHAAGVIHRDLKSENVFVVSDGRGAERVVLMDFGLARALDGSVVSSWPATASVLAGTLDCMAPEQIQGKRAEVPADIFAMGVLMFEVFVGRRPFVNMPPLERLQGPVTPPSRWAPDLERAWDAATTRCLALAPAARFPSVAALRAALPMPAKEASPPPPAGRRALPLYLGLGAAAVATAAAAWFL